MNVLMIGPSRDSKGGMTSVVDNYFNNDLDKLVNLQYCETINDKSIIEKVYKEVSGLLKFLKIINGVDIIHAHMASGRSTIRKIIYIKIAKKKNKKVILHIHGGGFVNFYDSQTKRKQERIRHGLNLADKIIVLSQEWKDYFKNIVEEKKINILHNGVPVPINFKKNLDNNNILFLGRICEDKGVYTLIEAISILKKEYSNIILTIGGSGEDEKLKNMIKKFDLTNNIKFVGWINGEMKEKQLIENSIFILPSRFEAMPVSILEAMAYKNVVICTKVGGIPQIIVDNVNGILINDSSVNEIVKGLKQILQNKKIKLDLSKEGRYTIEQQFNIKDNIKELYNLYCDLAN